MPSVAPYQPLRPSRSEALAIRQQRYHVRLWGNAASTQPPLVMVHGWMDVAASYQFTIDALSPELLAQLAASDAPLQRALDAEAAKAMDLPAVNYDEPGFRFALNEDAMATEKLAEGIRAFAVDAVKLEKLILAA